MNDKLIELNNHIELVSNNIDVFCNNLVYKNDFNDNIDKITLFDLIICFSNNNMLPKYDTLVDINNNSYINISYIGSKEFVDYFKKQLQILKQLHDRDLLEIYKNNSIISYLLDNHYNNNRHHPEYFYKGIRGTNIIDITEMLCDWYATCNNSSDIYKLIDINQKKYGYGKVLKRTLENTIDSYF